MLRAAFMGLDFSSARIRHSSATIEAEEFTAQPAGELAAGITRTAWQDAEEFLQIGNATRLPLNRLRLKELLKLKFALAQAPVRDAGQVNGIGLAIPYCAAAWIRQGLAEIFLGPAAIKRNAVWEAPIAAAIAACLDQQADPSAEGHRQLVISPSPLGMEATRLRLRGVGDVLHVYVESIHEFFEDDSSSQLQEAAPSLREWARERKLTLVGAETNKLVASAADLIGAQAVTSLPDVSEAVARLAAIEHRQRLQGSSFSKITPHRILARALGIVGQNGAGELFWRRLFAAGDSWEPSLEANLQLTSLPGDRRAVLLADIRSPAPTWETLSDSENRVIARYYSHKDLAQQGSAWKLQVDWLPTQTRNLPGEGITLKPLSGGARG